MINILNLTLPELTEFMVNELKEPKFRAKQVWQWLWSHGAQSFNEMTDVSKITHAALAETAASRFAPPSTALTLTRVLYRSLSGGKQIVVTRRYSIACSCVNFALNLRTCPLRSL